MPRILYSNIVIISVRWSMLPARISPRQGPHDSIQSVANVPSVIISSTGISSVADTLLVIGVPLVVDPLSVVDVLLVVGN